jgi:hypothetical protein
MAWEQGPYPATDGCVRTLAPADAAAAVRDRKIDCIYSLFQAYNPTLWGPATAGVEDDVWTILRRLLLGRQRGAFDVPIVRHWGFDVHNLDPEVTRALDGHLVCNREKLDYWRTPVRDGGCGLDPFGDGVPVGFLDSDRPKLEFMNDRFGASLSDGDGEPHTVCIGRPFSIDYLAAARRGIHVHVYGNTVDAVHGWMARDLRLRDTKTNAALLRHYVQVHPSLQTLAASWPEVREIKGRWVEEFSRYDAAWSYIGNPLAFPALEDRATIPNRLGTYFLAGLPIITDRRPGSYRYEEVHRRGASIELEADGYDSLRARLDTELRTRGAQRAARERRYDYSFDATADPLLRFLEEARENYYAKPYRERIRFLTDGSRRLVHLDASGSRRAIAWQLLKRQTTRRGFPTRSKVRGLMPTGGQGGRRLLAPWTARRLARTLGENPSQRSR